MVGQGVGIARLIDHGRLEVGVGEHALLLTVAQIARSIGLVHPLLDCLASNACRPGSSQVRASCLLVDDLRGALERAISALLSVVLAVDAHVFVAVGGLAIGDRYRIEVWLA